MEKVRFKKIFVKNLRADSALLNRFIKHETDTQILYLMESVAEDSNFMKSRTFCSQADTNALHHNLIRSITDACHYHNCSIL